MRIPKTSLRILMRNRSDAFRNPGGDTVLMERLRDGLHKSGHKVDIDLENSSDPGRYNLVHLFNLTLPTVIRDQTQDIIREGIPFVIHALQEDWPRFLNRSQAAAIVLEKYVATGQQRKLLAPSLSLLRECPAAEMPFCSEARLASSIICTGAREARIVGKLYPGTKLDSISLGAGFGVGEVELNTDESEAFHQAFGLKDFVLCVGRLEPRKNQLMLLAAMEEDDIAVVFADGGLTYAPEYAEACRRFVRRGRTVFTGRLSSQMLRSAYQSARVCCSPSWYELPGLATLEAALRCRQVVASPWGTITDYLGQECRYAEPDDAAAIRTEILQAWDSPPNHAMREVAAGFTWERTARLTEALYLDVTGKR